MSSHVFILHEYSETGREFPYTYSYYNDDTDYVEKNLQIMLWWKKRHTETKSKVGEIAKWMLSRNTNLKSSVDA